MPGKAMSNAKRVPSGYPVTRGRGEPRRVCLHPVHHAAACMVRVAASRTASQDCGVAGAAADMRLQPMADGGIVGVRDAAQQGMHRHDQTGGAEAALHCSRLQKGLLHGIKTLALG